MCQIYHFVCQQLALFPLLCTSFDQRMKNCCRTQTRLLLEEKKGQLRIEEQAGWRHRRLSQIGVWVKNIDLLCALKLLISLSRGWQMSSKKKKKNWGVSKDIWAAVSFISICLVLGFCTGDFNKNKQILNLKLKQPQKNDTERKT